MATKKITKKDEKKAVVATEQALQPTSYPLDMTRVIKQFWTSEKGTRLQASNQYMFLVDLHANKPEVKKAIQARYGVHVTQVNAIVMKGKKKFMRNRASKRSDFKKVFVTLKAGEKIETT